MEIITKLILRGWFLVSIKNQPMVSRFTTQVSVQESQIRNMNCNYPLLMSNLLILKCFKEPQISIPEFVHLGNYDKCGMRKDLLVVWKPCEVLVPQILLFITEKFSGDQQNKSLTSYLMDLFKLHTIAMWLVRSNQSSP